MIMEFINSPRCKKGWSALVISARKKQDIDLGGRNDILNDPSNCVPCYHCIFLSLNAVFKIALKVISDLFLLQVLLPQSPMKELSTF